MRAPRGPFPLRVAALALALALPPAVAAGAPDAPADPERWVAEALAAAPDLAGLAAREAALAERVRPAGALPDPMVAVTLQDVGFPAWTVGEQEMSMLGVEAQQGLLWPGKRDARRAAAAGEAAQARAATEAARRRLAAQVRALAAELYAIDRETEALRQAGELLDLLAATAAARYGAGEGDQADVLRRRLERSGLAARADDLAARRAAVAAELNRLRDRPGGEPLAAPAALPDLPLPGGDWEARAAGAASAVAVARAALAAAEARGALARAEARPDLFAGAGWAARGEFDRVVTLRLGAALPLWSGARQAPLRRAAAWEAEAARRELAAAAAAARAEAAALAARIARDDAQVARLRDEILPATSAVFDAARTAYLAGTGDLAAVVADLRAWLEARAELARRQAARYATRAAAAALLGTDPAEGGSR